MEITRTVPVTISIEDSDCAICGDDCPFLTAEGDECCKYSATIGIAFFRCPACLAEFGTGVEDETDCK